MAMSVGGGRRRRRPDVGHQHHAARRRDAGAPDHLPDHRSGGDPVGADHPAERPQRADRNQAGERLADGARRSRRNVRGLLEPDPVTNEELLDRAVKELEDADRQAVGGVENITEENMPEVHIRGDINTPYKCIGGTVFTMQRAGFARVGFISQPPPGGAGHAPVS